MTKTTSFLAALSSRACFNRSSYYFFLASFFAAGAALAAGGAALATGRALATGAAAGAATGALATGAAAATGAALAAGAEASRMVTEVTSVEATGAEAGQDEPPQLSRSRDRTVSTLLFI